MIDSLSSRLPRSTPPTQPRVSSADAKRNEDAAWGPNARRVYNWILNNVFDAQVPDAYRHAAGVIVAGATEDDGLIGEDEREAVSKALRLIITAGQISNGKVLRPMLPVFDKNGPLKLDPDVRRMIE